MRLGGEARAEFGDQPRAGGGRQPAGGGVIMAVGEGVQIRAGEHVAGAVGVDGFNRRRVDLVDPLAVPDQRGQLLAQGLVYRVEDQLCGRVFLGQGLAHADCLCALSSAEIHAAFGTKPYSPG